MCLIHKFIEKNGTIFCERCGKAVPCNHFWKYITSVKDTKMYRHTGAIIESIEDVLECRKCGDRKVVIR